MMHFLLAFLVSTLPLAALTLSNIPQYRPEAMHVISFCVPHTTAEPWLKKAMLERLREPFHIDLFIETGTYLGNTASEAAQVFKTVHTIELCPRLYAEAKKRLSCQNNVFCHLGDSGEYFHQLLPFLSERPFFYLDGHYSGPGTAQGDEDYPILAELQAIERADAVILVDDIRCFSLEHKTLGLLKNSIYPSAPTLNALIDALLRINPSYQLCFLGDTLLAFPPDSNVTVSSLVSACTLHRLAPLCAEYADLKTWDPRCGQASFSEPTMPDRTSLFFCLEYEPLLRQLREIPKIISQAKGAERDAIIVYHQFFNSFDESKYPSFWRQYIDTSCLPEEPRVKILYTAALIPYKFEERKEEYIRCLKTLDSFGYRSKVYIAEAGPYSPDSFFERYCPFICHTNINDTTLINKGVNEAKSMLAAFSYFDFDDEDMIVKLTGRYQFDRNDFLRFVEERPELDAVALCWPKERVVTGCFALRYKFFKRLLENLDFHKMEEDLIDIEFEVYDFLQKIASESANVAYLDAIGITANIANVAIQKW